MIHFISDTHFDHANIIGYCNRPFSSVEEMNEYMLNKWNSVVDKNDIVYFLGDLSYGRGRRPHGFWLSQLNGKIMFVRGSHDDGCLDGIESHSEMRIFYEGITFLVIHSPYEASPKHYEWTVHGHVHNNNLEKYPLFNPVRRSVNVSVELIDYTPVSIEKILDMIKGA